MKKKNAKEFLKRVACLTLLICACMLWPTIFGILGAKNNVPCDCDSTCRMYSEEV